MVAYNIHEVLGMMANMGDQAFRIEFVKSTGKDQGQIKKTLAYYGAPNPKDRQAPTALQQQGRAPRRAHIDSGTIPLTEFGSRKMLTPRIDHIISFNNHKVYH